MKTLKLHSVMFQNPFSFEGRIRRTEYAISHLLYYLLTVILSIIDLFIEIQNIIKLVGMIFYIFLIWFKIAQSSKRCHDLGKPWWFQLIPFYVLWLLFEASQYGVNKYGLNPKD